MRTNATPEPPDHLGRALKDIILHPIRTLVPPWSWKAAALASLVRAASFFASNIKSGEASAVRASLVEAAYAILAAGLIGAISQRLRRSDPLWETVAVVCIGLPGVTVLAQAGVHRLAHTPHLSAGLIASFCFSALSAGFSWFAMRHGAMLGGTDATGVLDDMKALPRIALDFVTAVPRSLLKAND